MDHGGVSLAHFGSCGSSTLFQRQRLKLQAINPNATAAPEHNNVN